MFGINIKLVLYLGAILFKERCEIVKSTFVDKTIESCHFVGAHMIRNISVYYLKHKIIVISNTLLVFRAAQIISTWKKTDQRTGK